MIDQLTSTAAEYFAFYNHMLVSEWNHMTPLKYGSILIGIAVFGWLLMKSAARPWKS